MRRLGALEALKTLITQQGISLSVDKADSGQIEKIHDLEIKDSSP